MASWRTTKQVEVRAAPSRTSPVFFKADAGRLFKQAGDVQVVEGHRRVPVMPRGWVDEEQLELVGGSSIGPPCRCMEARRGDDAAEAAPTMAVTTSAWERGSWADNEIWKRATTADSWHWSSQAEAWWDVEDSWREAERPISKFSGSRNLLAEPSEGLASKLSDSRNLREAVVSSPSSVSKLCDARNLCRAAELAPGKSSSSSSSAAMNGSTGSVRAVSEPGRRAVASAGAVSWKSVMDDRWTKTHPVSGTASVIRTSPAKKTEFESQSKWSSCTSWWEVDQIVAWSACAPDAVDWRSEWSSDSTSRQAQLSSASSACAKSCTSDWPLKAKAGSNANSDELDAAAAAAGEGAQRGREFAGREPTKTPSSSATLRCPTPEFGISEEIFEDVRRFLEGVDAVDSADELPCATTPAGHEPQLRDEYPFDASLRFAGRLQHTGMVECPELSYLFDIDSLTAADSPEAKALRPQSPDDGTIVCFAISMDKIGKPHIVPKSVESPEDATLFAGTLKSISKKPSGTEVGWISSLAAQHLYKSDVYLFLGPEAQGHSGDLASLRVGDAVAFSVHVNRQGKPQAGIGTVSKLRARVPGKIAASTSANVDATCMQIGRTVAVSSYGLS